MADYQRFFQEEFTGPESGLYAFDLSSLHWSMWGQQINYELSEKGVDPKRRSKYDIFVRLGTTPFSVAPETLELSADEIKRTGDSCFDASAETMVFEFGVDGQRIRFNPISNANARLAGFESHDIESTLGEAIVIAKQAVNNILLSLVAPTRTPCFLDQIHIRSTDGKQRYYRTIAHFPLTAPANRPLTISALVPTITLYAEGIRASSVFYRFLCFYKIVEQIIDTVAPALTRAGASVAEGPLKFNVTIPSPEFDSIAPNLIGKKVTAVRSDFQKEYRNVIAHFDLNSPIQPFFLEAEAALQVASAVMFFAADALLKEAHTYINEIKRKGFNVESLTF